MEILGAPQLLQGSLGAGGAPWMPGKPLGCWGSSLDAGGPVDAAGFCGSAGTGRSWIPGNPRLLEALGCRGSLAAGGAEPQPLCALTRMSGCFGVRRQVPHPSPAAGGGSISPRHPVPDAARGGWCLVVSSSPHVPAAPRGQSQHRRAMAGGKGLSAWALLASLAVASWGVRGESAGVGSAAGHCPWCLDMPGECWERAPRLAEAFHQGRFGMFWGKRNQCNRDRGACFAQSVFGTA